MLNSAQIPIKASTQDQLPVEDIQDNLVILKDGSCALILSVSAVNFGLLSEKEQDAIIFAYGALLNSLAYPIQILVRSQKKDISSYLRRLEEQEIQKKASPLLSGIIQNYRKFVAEMVKKNNVLDKKFYIIIPFSFLELGVASGLSSLLKKDRRLPYPKDYILQKAKTALFPKKDHLIRLLNRVGLHTKQVQTEELVKLFYEIYNHESLAKSVPIRI